MKISQESRRVRAAVALAGALWLGASCALRVDAPRPAPELASRLGCVAVLPFENHSRGPGAGDAVAEMVSGALVLSNRTNVVEPAEVRGLLDTRGMDVGGASSPARAQAIGEAIGVEAVLGGSVLAFGKTDERSDAVPVAFSTQLIDVPSGTVVWSGSVAYDAVDAAARQPVLAGFAIEAADALARVIASARDRPASRQSCAKPRTPALASKVARPPPTEAAPSADLARIVRGETPQPRLAAATAADPARRAWPEDAAPSSAGVSTAAPARASAERSSTIAAGGDPTRGGVAPGPAVAWPGASAPGSAGPSPTYIPGGNLTASGAGPGLDAVPTDSFAPVRAVPSGAPTPAGATSHPGSRDPLSTLPALPALPAETPPAERGAATQPGSRSPPTPGAAPSALPVVPDGESPLPALPSLPSLPAEPGGAEGLPALPTTPGGGGLPGDLPPLPGIPDLPIEPDAAASEPADEYAGLPYAPAAPEAPPTSRTKLSAKLRSLLRQLYVGTGVTRRWFRQNTAAMQANARPAAADVAALLKAVPDLRIAFEVHADAGTAAGRSQRISDQQLMTLQAYFESKYPFAKGRVFFRSLGNRRPVAKDVSARARAQNTRIEIRRVY